MGECEQLGKAHRPRRKRRRLWRVYTTRYLRFQTLTFSIRQTVGRLCGCGTLSASLIECFYERMSQLVDVL